MTETVGPGSEDLPPGGRTTLELSQRGNAPLPPIAKVPKSGMLTIEA